MSSEIKVTNIKHASSGSNNLVLGSDGNVSITNSLSAGTIGSGVSFHQNTQPAFSFYSNGSNQSCSGSNYNKIELNQADCDTVSGFNDSEDRYDFQVAGTYFLFAQVQFGGGIVSNNTLTAGIYFYDTSASSGTTYSHIAQAPQYDGYDNICATVIAVVNASVGDYVYAQAKRSTTSSDTTEIMHGSDRNTVFSGFKILG
tara:strand:- start:964 stop:1563 length:600 start_codon:yes stop_codon:yes gene_type:complete